MEEYNSYKGRGAPSLRGRRISEPSRGAEVLKAIRRELAEVRARFDHFEDEELSRREEALVLMEKQYSIYDKRFKRFIKHR